jgi:hypothetical protein
MSCAYFLTCVERATCASMSGHGAIFDAGGISRTAKGGVGTPFGDSTVTKASPIPSVVSVSSTS